MGKAHAKAYENASAAFPLDTKSPMSTLQSSFAYRMRP